MNKSNLVFRIQFSQFKREKGMIIFYCLSIAIAGILVPIFMHRMESALTMAALLSATFLKPILSDSIAGERERRTLETLLSTPINGKTIILGKFKFCLFFAVCYFGTTVVCATLVSWLVGYKSTLVTWQWISIMLLAFSNFSAISIAGVHASATSSDLRVANSRVSRVVYLLGLLFVAYLSVVTLDFYVAIITGFILLFIYVCVVIVYSIKSIKMKQSNYFENIKTKAGVKLNKNYALQIVPKSKFGIILEFELKYLLTLKTLLLNFGAMCFAPAVIAFVLPKYTGTGYIDLNYAVFLSLLLIPRVPTNLIAYSIGGEKVYKTGESLLSTPLQTKTIFLAKCAVPVLVSTAMLILSSIFTLIGANLFGQITPYMVQPNGYTAAQLVLLFPVGVMSSIVMIFVSAILSVILKTPRHGLYATSAISFLFVIPVIAIVYLAHNVLLWSVIYFVVLLGVSTICVRNITDGISRPQIMNRL